MIEIFGGLSFLIFLTLLGIELWPRARATSVFFVVWILVYGGVAATGYFVDHSHDFPPVPVRVMIALLAGLLVSQLFPAAREPWNSIPTERLVRLHSIRGLIGLIFIYTAAQGGLAPEFGERAGWGDLVAGGWALLYVFTPRLRTWRGTLAWSLVATTDLCVAVGTAALTFEGPFQKYPHAELLRPLTELPLAMIPGFAVPVLFFTHFLIFKRLIHK